MTKVQRQSSRLQLSLRSKTVVSLVGICLFATAAICFFGDAPTSSLEINNILEAAGSASMSVVRSSSYLLQPSSGEIISEMVATTTNTESSSNEVVQQWTAKMNYKCPKQMVPNSTTILQTDQYADRVGIVTIAMKRKEIMQIKALHLVRSIRRRGAWLGPIILIVDSNVDDKKLRRKLSEELYGNSTTHSNIHVVRASKSDFTDLGGAYMSYKRFKTHLFDVLPQDLKHLEYLLYLDVDIVVGKPMKDFFKRALPLLGDSSTTGTTTTTTKNSWLFFREQGSHPAQSQARKNQWTLYHGGVFMVHREKSKECLQEWQRRFDANTFPNDQSALLDLLYEHNDTVNIHHNCPVGELPSDHLLMPRQGFLKEGKTRTFVHFTHARIKRFGAYIEDYKKCTLLL